jgi:hypothetical protein
LNGVTADFGESFTPSMSKLPLLIMPVGIFTRAPKHGGADRHFAGIGLAVHVDRQRTIASLLAAGS